MCQELLGFGLTAKYVPACTFVMVGVMGMLKMPGHSSFTLSVTACTYSIGPVMLWTSTTAVCVLQSDTPNMTQCVSWWNGPEGWELRSGTLSARHEHAIEDLGHKSLDKTREGIERAVEAWKSNQVLVLESSFIISYFNDTCS